jgi:multidrug efflux pump subunit AcrA (membrane-fusion protein)
LLCTDLRAEAAAARAEAAAARAEAQRQQSEFDRVVKERDQSRGRAAEAESRAETLAADLAVAQVAASEQRARAGGTPWPSLVFVPACFLCLCLRSFFWLFAELESTLDESAKALAGAAEQREADHAAMSEAVSDVYRVLGSGDVPSGSSPQSRLQVFGDHVRGRLREALHHSVRRAFAVLASHYVVDLERVSGGVLPSRRR